MAEFEPVEVAKDADLGEDVARAALGRWQYEWLAAYGTGEPDEEIPSEEEARRQLEQ